MARITSPAVAPVRIPAKAHETLRELTAYVARNGWSALGIDRADLPTQSALVEEAIELLATRRTKKGKAKR